MYDLGYAVNRRTDDHRKKKNLLSHRNRMDNNGLQSGTDHKDVHAACKGDPLVGAAMSLFRGQQIRRRSLNLKAKRREFG